MLVLLTAVATHVAVWHYGPIKIRAVLLAQTVVKVLRKQPTPAEVETTARRKDDPRALRVTIDDLIRERVDDFRMGIPWLSYELPVLLEAHEGLCLVAVETLAGTSDVPALVCAILLLLVAPLGFWLYGIYRVHWLIRGGHVVFEPFHESSKRKAIEDVKGGTLDLDKFALKGEWVEPGDNSRYLPKYGSLFEEFVPSFGGHFYGVYALFKNIILAFVLNCLGAHGVLQTWLLFLLSAATWLYMWSCRPYVERKVNLMVGYTSFQEAVVVFFHFWVVSPGFLGVTLEPSLAQGVQTACIVPLISQLFLLCHASNFMPVLLSSVILNFLLPFMFPTECVCQWCLCPQGCCCWTSCTG
jgi:hypothetical protein